MAKPHDISRELGKALQANPRPAEHLRKGFTTADVVKAHAAQVAATRNRVARRKKSQGQEEGQVILAAINEMKRGLTVLVAAALLAGCASTPPALLRPGVISLDTTDPKYQTYFRQVREKIRANWIYPYEAGARGVEGDLIIKFAIAKNGDLQRIELLRSSGKLILDNAALNAVKLAVRVPPVGQSAPPLIR